jgi:hypothetical protein
MNRSDLPSLPRRVRRMARLLFEHITGEDPYRAPPWVPHTDLPPVFLPRPVRENPNRGGYDDQLKEFKRVQGLVASCLLESAE